MRTVKEISDYISSLPGLAVPPAVAALADKCALSVRECNAKIEGIAKANDIDIRALRSMRVPPGAAAALASVNEANAKIERIAESIGFDLKAFVRTHPVRLEAR